MKKLTLVFAGLISLMNVTGCQSWNNAINNSVYSQNQKLLSKPKNVEKCWKTLADFDRKVEKHPVLANAYARLLEKNIYASTRDIQGTQKNPCVMLNNYVPAAHRSISRARYIGSQYGNRRS